MRKSDIFHNYFYQTDKVCRPRHYNVGYDRDFFYSYATTVGYKMEKNGKKILLFSRDRMSNTTCASLYDLRQACPTEYTVIKVPFMYGYSFREKEQVLSFLKKNFEAYLKDSQRKDIYYTRKENRERLDSLIKDAKDFNSIVRIKGLAKAIKFHTKVNSQTYQEETSKKIRKQSLKKRILTQKLLKRISKHYYQTIKEVFTSPPSIKKEQEKALIRLSKIRDSWLAFVWKEGENIRTSKQISVPVAKVKPLLERWVKNQSILGQSLEEYRVLGNDELGVKVECHYIPKQNIIELAKDMGVIK